jgi:hypothetical protein
MQIIKENLEISSQDGIDGMETQYLTTKKKRKHKYKPGESLLQIQHQ